MVTKPRILLGKTLALSRLLAIYIINTSFEYLKEKIKRITKVPDTKLATYNQSSNDGNCAKILNQMNKSIKATTTKTSK